MNTKEKDLHLKQEDSAGSAGEPSAAASGAETVPADEPPDKFPHMIIIQKSPSVLDVAQQGIRFILSHDPHFSDTGI